MKHGVEQEQQWAHGVRRFSCQSYTPPLPPRMHNVRLSVADANNKPSPLTHCYRTPARIRGHHNANNIASFPPHFDCITVSGRQRTTNKVSRARHTFCAISDFDFAFFGGGEGRWRGFNDRDRSTPFVSSLAAGRVERRARTTQFEIDSATREMARRRNHIRKPQKPRDLCTHSCSRYHHKFHLRWFTSNKITHILLQHTLIRASWYLSIRCRTLHRARTHTSLLTVARHFSLPTGGFFLSRLKISPGQDQYRNINCM